MHLGRPLRERLEYFKKNPTTPQTKFFREGNLKLAAENFQEFRKGFREKETFKVLDIGCSDEKKLIV